MSDRVNERRQFGRVDFREPIQFRIGEQKIIGCLAQDISDGGIKVNSFEFLPLNTEIQLNIQLKDEDAADLAGKVVWIQQVPFSDQFQIGVKFLADKESPKTQELIHRHLQSRRF